MSKQDAQRVAKFLDSEQFSFAKKPITVEYGEHDVVFFRDADNLIFACIPKDLYEETLSLNDPNYNDFDSKLFA